jgi:hypothetical protein
LSLPLPARLGRVSLLCVGIVVLALGGFARFHDLGGAPLAEDEYYTTRSIEWLLADGVPAQPGGGYYDRGLLYQYAAAGSALLFGADAFAYRLPAALCGLLAGVLGFFYARRCGGVAIGLVVAAAVLLSSWEIEFSRLVRFYTMFQVALLLFLIALDRAYFERSGDSRYWPHAIVVVASFAHELAVLLVPLLFLPLFPQMTRLRLENRRRWLAFALVSLLVAAMVVLLTVVLSLGKAGVIDSLPADFQRPPGEADRGLAMPIFPFYHPFEPPILNLAAILALAAGTVGAFALARRLGVRRLELPDLLLALALLAGLCHLFAALALVLLLAFARYDLWRLRAQPPRRLILLAAIVAIVLGWLALTVAAPERLLVDDAITRWNMVETRPGVLGATLRAAWSTFFGWPDFYRMTLRPFAVELPALGLATIAALIWFIVAHRHAAWPDLLRQPGAFVLYWAIATGMFAFSSTTSRYWFPLLPVLYALLAISLAEAATRWLPAAGRVGGRLAGTAFLLVFALGPDFHPDHLLRPGDDAVRFRTGAFARFADTWYPRHDVRTAAATVARWHAAAPGVRIVVDTLPALSYYLDEEHAIYYDRCGKRFRSYARERGTRDMWSGRRLVGRPADVLAYADPNEELWLLREADALEPGIDLAALADAGLTELGRERIGEDGGIEIVRLRLAGAAGAPLRATGDDCTRPSDAPGAARR